MKVQIKTFSTIAPICCAWLMLSTFSMAQPVISQQERPVLGIVDLGSTTLKQFQEAIKEKGCKYEEKDNSVLVPSGCFRLPGKPEISALSPDSSGKIELVQLKFSRDKDFSSSTTYLMALRKTRDEAIASSGNLNIGEFLWRSPKVSVLLALTNHDPYGYIYFFANKYFDQNLANKWPEVSENSDLAVF
ncbi:MAG: hypothetical protein LUC43_03815 [Burkholderiales bacterium]|nr:hypothetical protein [Burkholderiales bacterium]